MASLRFCLFFFRLFVCLFVCFQNNSFLGCLPSLKDFTLDGETSISAIESVKGLKVVNCIETCHSLMQALAVFTYKDKARSHASCVCLKRMWHNMNKLRDTDSPQKCTNQLFATNWGLSQCTYAKFLDPKQTIVPQVCL